MNVHNNEKIGDLFKHEESGEILRLISLRKSNINTFLIVDKDNIPIKEKQEWSTTGKKEQNRIINGVSKLIKYEAATKRIAQHKTQLTLNL